MVRLMMRVVMMVLLLMMLWNVVRIRVIAVSLMVQGEHGNVLLLHKRKGIVQVCGAIAVIVMPPSLLLEGQFALHLLRQVCDKLQCLPSLVHHQAHRAGVDDAPQRDEILVLADVVAGEVRRQVAVQLFALLRQLAEVDEEPGAHVTFELLDFGVARRIVVPHQEIAVLEETATADLLGVSRGDEFVVEVVQRLVEIAEHALAHDGREEVTVHGHLGEFVEEQQRVEDDLERVDAELELPPHAVDEFQFDVFAEVIGETDQAPSVVVIRDLHHLVYVRVLHGARTYPVLVHAIREKFEQGFEHGLLDNIHAARVGQIHSKNQIQIVIRLLLLT